MTVEPPEGEKYTHGYQEAIIESYRRRTAEICAAFLLPRLQPDAAVLDMGCGPGTITVGLARRTRGDLRRVQPLGCRPRRFLGLP